jgi:RNA polymerase sigma-70 factor (ECF subfamily)
MATDRPEPAGPSDHSLLVKFQRGQGDAATELYVRYAKRLRALVKAQRGADLAARVDPEDIVQSVFRTFFRRAAEGHYDVPRGEELWKLFLVIALYKVRDTAAFHRAEKRDVRRTAAGADVDRSAAEHLRSGSGGNEEALTVLQLVIDEILAKLPSSHRQIVELRVEGHEVADIAAQTGRAKRSVERILQEFRGRLSAAIRADE